jgi:hypothetical protein
MKIVGCDLHTRYQQIALVDQETGEFIERRLEHESGEARMQLAVPFSFARQIFSRAATSYRGFSKSGCGPEQHQYSPFPTKTATLPPPCSPALPRPKTGGWV